VHRILRTCVNNALASPALIIPQLRNRMYLVHSLTNFCCDAFRNKNLRQISEGSKSDNMFKRRIVSKLQAWVDGIFLDSILLIQSLWHIRCMEYSV